MSRSLTLLLVAPLFVACVAEPAGSESTRAAEATSQSFYLIPVDARARSLCHEENEQRYCTRASVDAARAACVAKIGAWGWFDPCTSGSDSCLRIETFAGETCAADGPVYPDLASCSSPKPQNCS